LKAEVEKLKERDIAVQPGTTLVLDFRANNGK
jgi:hypothetical protein